MVKAIPEGHHSLTPTLSLDRCADAIEFFKKAFGVRELSRFADPSGKKVWHADLQLGDSHLFVNDTFPEAERGKAFPGSLWIYTAEVDAAFKRAVDAGCQVVMPLADMFWGDRFGTVVDPWGNRWFFAKRLRDMTPDELVKAGRAQRM